MGLWAVARRTSGQTKTVQITVRSSPRITPAIRTAIEDEAAVFGRFVDREPALQIVG